MVVGGPFFIADGDASTLLETVDEPFDPVALAVGRAVEARGAPLVYLARDHRADAPPSQRLPDRLAAVALVAHQAPWADARPTRTVTLDSSPRGQERQGHLVVPLPPRQDQDDQLAPAFGPHMDFGAEPAPTSPQGFRRWAPLFA